MINIIASEKRYGFHFVSIFYTCPFSDISSAIVLALYFNLLQEVCLGGANSDY